MAFPILGAGDSSSGYNIENSLRLNNDAELEFTPGSEGNKITFTISVWVKRGNLGSGNLICSSGAGSGSKFELTILDTDQLWVESSSAVILQTAARYRDPSAWMHIVFKYDSTPATPDSSDVALYVNGSQITSFDTYETYPSQNNGCYWMDDVEHNIGKRTYSDVFFDGYMAEFVAIDGLALSPSSFGETDANSGIWKPKDVSGLTFGTNGFYLEFKQSGTSQNSSGIGADTSGNDNHFAVTNLTAIDQCTDTPTNNFATLNPLWAGAEATLSEGNCKYTGGTTSGLARQQVCGGTFGVSNGKWYFEVTRKSNTAVVGIISADIPRVGYDSAFGSRYSGQQHGILASDGNAYSGNANTAYGSAIDDDDIIGVALDMDNDAIYYSDNGTFMDSGDPTSGASKTGAAPNFTAVDTYVLGWVADAASGSSSVYEFNFGNPPHSISSGNADANGYGNFEYAVPSGYYAPCTKNLAKYG